MQVKLVHRWSEIVDTAPISGLHRYKFHTHVRHLELDFVPPFGMELDIDEHSYTVSCVVYKHSGRYLLVHVSGYVAHTPDDGWVEEVNG